MAQAEASRNTKVAAQLLAVATEDEIVAVYQWRKNRYPNVPYPFYRMQYDWTGNFNGWKQAQRNSAAACGGLAASRERFKARLDEMHPAAILSPG
jgi:hypothetical protein